MDPFSNDTWYWYSETSNMDGQHWHYVDANQLSGQSNFLSKTFFASFFFLFVSSIIFVVFWRKTMSNNTKTNKTPLAHIFFLIAGILLVVYYLLSEGMPSLGNNIVSLMKFIVELFILILLIGSISISCLAERDAKVRLNLLLQPYWFLLSLVLIQ